VCSQWKVTAHLAVFNSHASKSNAVLLELAAAHADTPPSVSEQTLKSVEAMLNNTHGLPQQLTVLAKGLDNSM
jgi:hypothetical protein